MFAARRFAGNPLAVVDGVDGLAADQMLAIVREFNLSETVFLLSSLDSVRAARIRTFNPEREQSFAGHPTIGAAGLIAETRAAASLSANAVTVVLRRKSAP